MTQTCVVEGCDRTDVRCRGMCRCHYRRYERHGDPHIVWPSNHPAYTITCAVKECAREPTEVESGMCHYHHWTAHVWPLPAVFADPWPGWDDHAACRGMDTNDWYLEVHQTVPPTHVIQACAGCPVRGECLTVGWREHYGVWGGVSAGERRRIRRRERRSAA